VAAVRGAGVNGRRDAVSLNTARAQNYCVK
jgi:hypothetical protein